MSCWTVAPIPYSKKKALQQHVELLEAGFEIRLFQDKLLRFPELQSLSQLLGSQSNDIDVALSDIMGLAFAKHLSAFARVKGVEIGSITAIEQNPEQSKHLETATFKIFGLNIDLVNLRSEEYAESSRIPTEVVSIPPFLKSGRVISYFLPSLSEPLSRMLCDAISLSMRCFTTSTPIA